MIANKIYRGSTEISKAYLNGQIVYGAEVVDNAFTATYQIDDISEPLTLPVSKDYEINWGDGVTTTTGNQHFYTSTGVYTVKMFGVIDDFAFNNVGDKSKILTVKNWGGLIIIDSCFYGCSNLDVTAVDIPVVSNSLNSVFRACSKLVFNDSINNWDVSNVTTLGTMFFLTPLFDQPLNNWDVKNVTSLSSTFRNSKFNHPINNWNTSNVEIFNSTFRNNLFFNQDISNLDYSKATLLAEIMGGKSNLNYNYQLLDSLYNKWAFGDPVTGEGKLNFSKIGNQTTNFGTIQYSSAGAAARASLVSQGLIITDGGQNAF